MRGPANTSAVFGDIDLKMDNFIIIEKNIYPNLLMNNLARDAMWSYGFHFLMDRNHGKYITSN